MMFIIQHVIVLLQAKIGDPLLVQFHQQSQAEIPQTAPPDRLRVKAIRSAISALLITLQQVALTITAKLPAGPITDGGDF